MILEDLKETGPRRNRSEAGRFSQEVESATDGGLDFLETGVENHVTIDRDDALAREDARDHQESQDRVVLDAAPSPIFLDKERQLGRLFQRQGLAIVQRVAEFPEPREVVAGKALVAFKHEHVDAIALTELGQPASVELERNGLLEVDVIGEFIPDADDKAHPTHLACLDRNHSENSSRRRAIVTRQPAVTLRLN